MRAAKKYATMTMLSKKHTKEAAKMQKSNKFLTVTGILMIIGGGIGVILGVIAVAGVGLLAASLEELGISSEAGLLMLAAILYLVSAVVQLIAGILGVANARKPEKAMVCIVFGILTAILAILGNVLTVAGGGDFNVLGLVLGLALPILYLIGAFQNKSKAM